MVVPIPDYPAIGLMSMIATALTGRAYSPVGGAQRVANTFAEAVEKNGGEIEYSERVSSISLQKAPGYRRCAGGWLRNSGRFGCSCH
jgi:phytoene dehydrogenase-like protein